MFSALPGGMVEMVTSGRDMDADVKTLTIIHLMRVVIIVIGASILGSICWGPRSADADPVSIPRRIYSHAPRAGVRRMELSSLI